GLALELPSVRVREAGARLRFELVAREVLGLERQRLGEIGDEIGGALARDPVDEIEGDVVKSGTTEIVDRAPDVDRRRTPLEDAQQVRLEALSADRHTVDTVS